MPIQSLLLNSLEAQAAFSHVHSLVLLPLNLQVHVALKYRSHPQWALLRVPREQPYSYRKGHSTS